MTTDFETHPVGAAARLAALEAENAALRNGAATIIEAGAGHE